VGHIVGLDVTKKRDSTPAGSIRNTVAIPNPHVIITDVNFGAPYIL
jgi:hypothetical protein